MRRRPFLAAPRPLAPAGLVFSFLLVVSSSDATEGPQFELEQLQNEEGRLGLEPHHIAVKLTRRDDALANRLAAEHDCKVVGPPFLESHYFLVPLVEEAELAGRRRRSKRAVFKGLLEEEGVELAYEQFPKRRRKRDFVDNGGEQSRHQQQQQRTRRRPSEHGSDGKDAGKTTLHLPWADPYWGHQWYMRNGAAGGYDMRVIGAWKLGYSGRGVSVSILDDGIQTDHPDLARNYDPMASADINNHDDDPTPQDNGDNKHGTRCAGEVASVAGNYQCGVGIAFDAKIGGVRMLDGPVSDSVEAASLSLNQQHIDVYSASWGPEDDGRTFDGPGPLAREAFRKGITTGRGGRGNIFVWASGNGGSRLDSCSADGYTTSIYTLSISSATFDNGKPWYLEECPSSLASTYSSAGRNQPAIVTVDVPRGCTERHTGTSASAPLAAGIVALSLEANPNMTWRDMQHAVLRTADPTALLHNSGWSTNGVGRRVSNKFGYGLMDATALVKLAEVWHPLPEQKHCAFDYKLKPNPYPLEGVFRKEFTLVVGNECNDYLGGRPVLYLEHVQAVVTVRFSRRGQIKMTLMSPMGTRSVILPPRRGDQNRNGFHKWPFLSVQQWGEDPRGTWTLTIENVGKTGTDQPVSGTLHDWTLLLYGTSQVAQSGDPVHHSSSAPTPFPQSSSLGGRESTSGVTGLADYPEVENAPPPIGTTKVHQSNVGDCHAECEPSKGCSRSRSASACLKCRHYNMTMRNRAGYKCSADCPEGYYVSSSSGDGPGPYCKLCARVCKSCSGREICDSCHDGQLLVDVDFGHFHHGQCLDRCPSGLDRVDSPKPRCIRQNNPCSAHHYYDDAQRVCMSCHEACDSCRGSAAFDCFACSAGYGNSSLGYCRRCCAEQQRPSDDHCEYCTTATEQPKSAPSLTVVQIILAVVAVVLLAAFFFLCLSRKWTGGKDVRYKRLPVRLEFDQNGSAGLLLKTNKAADLRLVDAFSSDEDDNGPVSKVETSAAGIAGEH